MITLPQATACTPILIKAGLHGLVDLYKLGYSYNKAGIMLTGLSRSAMQQPNLFIPSGDARTRPVMEALDRINDCWGRDVLRYGSSGVAREWSLKQTWKSPAYTTSWGELPVVVARRVESCSKSARAKFNLVSQCDKAYDPNTESTTNILMRLQWPDSREYDL